MNKRKTRKNMKTVDMKTKHPDKQMENEQKPFGNDKK